MGFPDKTQTAKTVKGKVHLLDPTGVTSKPNPSGAKRLHQPSNKKTRGWEENSCKKGFVSRGYGFLYLITKSTRTKGKMRENWRRDPSRGSGCGQTAQETWWPGPRGEPPGWIHLTPIPSAKYKRNTKRLVLSSVGADLGSRGWVTMAEFPVAVTLEGTRCSY